MAKPEQRNITFEQFRKIIADELKVDEAKVVPEASFLDDFFADSIQMVEMLLRMEELGLNIPLEEAWEIQTVGDAYRYCVRGAASGA